MKKLLALMGICCLLVFMLSGCGGTEPDSDMDESTNEESMGTMGSAVEEAGTAAGEAAGQAVDDAQESLENAVEEATE
ncbi:MAG: hypothetical protein P8Z37_14265 [Acidobacteriota bacterium]